MSTKVSALIKFLALNGRLEAVLTTAFILIINTLQLPTRWHLIQNGTKNVIEWYLNLGWCCN